MSNDGAQNDQEYQVIGDPGAPGYEMHPPTNAKLKEVTRLELRGPASLSGKKDTARTMGWDPAEVIPGHSREEEVDGETITIDNDLGELSFLDSVTHIAGALFIGLEVEEDEGDLVLVDTESGNTWSADHLRIDVVQKARQDFMNGVFGTSAGSIL